MAAYASHTFNLLTSSIFMDGDVKGIIDLCTTNNFAQIYLYLLYIPQKENFVSSYTVLFGRNIKSSILLSLSLVA